jgi:hypothetical protein
MYNLGPWGSGVATIEKQYLHVFILKKKPSASESAYQFKSNLVEIILRKGDSKLFN